MSKKLIINADDYGLSPEVNDAIEGLIRQGRLGDVSVLANGWSYEGAAFFLRGRPECSVGAHLNAVEGVPLSPTDHVKVLIGENGQFVDLRRLFVRWSRSPLAVGRAVEYEWRAQIELLLRDGLVITHADSHQHVHAFPPFWRILSKLCLEYGIPAIRYPRERSRSPSRRTQAFTLGSLAALARIVTGKSSLVSSDHFLGFKRARTYGEAELRSDFSRLKEGVTEMIVHPSLYDGVPYPEINGEAEYRALQSSSLFDDIGNHGIELISWKDFVAA